MGFMWPGLMSITKPTERTCHLFDLGEEREVAADKPLNAQKVIGESRIRAANAPKVIVISKEEMQELGNEPNDGENVVEVDNDDVEVDPQLVGDDNVQVRIIQDEENEDGDELYSP